jgi:hypothetical protein
MIEEERLSESQDFKEIAKVHLHPSSRAFRPVLSSLEGRALMSHLGHVLPRPAYTALINPVRPAITTDPGGISAIMSALNGGMGSEWVKLIRARARNPRAVISGFVSGRINAYSIPGLTFKTPAVQPQFTGQPYDQLLPTVAGAAVFKGNVLEMGAIMRGPFHDPAPSYYTFAFNRGAGASLGPTFASRPGITPDAVVTLTVGPYGSTASGVLTDLTTGAAQAIPSSSISIRGPVVRVSLNTAQLPSKGLPIQKYRFAFWTQTQPGNDITTVADFAPETSMIPIAVLRGVKATR